MPATDGLGASNVPHSARETATAVTTNEIVVRHDPGSVDR
jgi:hypothetical protein